MSKKQATTKTTATTPETQAPTAPATETAPLSQDIITQLRAASSLDDAVRLLAPDAKPKVKMDAVYEVVETVAKPLPQKRGACVKVYAAAVRKNAAFTVKDITDALPDVKSAPYWVRRLARDAFFRESVVEVK
jgi:hypothetical protein